MEMHWFEKWVVNSFSGIYLRWHLLPRFLALMDGALRGRGLALGPGVEAAGFSVEAAAGQAIVFLRARRR